MRIDRRLAALAGAAGVLLAWWAATSGRPAAAPGRSPGPAPEAPAARNELPRAASPPALEPPAPVLQRSAERRFSSPSNGAAGGIAGADDASAPGTAGASRGSAMPVSLPGGYGAPVAGGPPAAGGRAEEAGPAGSAPAAAAERPPARGGAPARAGGGAPPGEQSPEDRKLAGAAGNLVAAARGLKSRGDAAALRAEAGLEAGLMRGLALDRKVDDGIRAAVSDLQSSGRATPEAVAKAAEGVLKDNGFEPEPEDVQAAVARASSPRPNVPEAAYSEAVKDMASTPPLPQEILVELQKTADKPPPPRAPAPKGALDAFRQNRAVLDKAQKDFGVKPEHILGILGVETGWGRNTGKFPIVRTLEQISMRTGRDGKPTRQAVQAANDLKALARLSAEGNLGGLKPSQVNSSYAGAMGIPQFLPTSWEAYSRAPDGGKRDPFEFGTAAYSVGNYLRAHGYAKDVPRSIWGYNHSQEYVDKVLGLSADVKASLPAPAK